MNYNIVNLRIYLPKNDAQGTKQPELGGTKSFSMKVDAKTTVSNAEEKKLNAEMPKTDVDAATSAVEEKSDEGAAGIKITYCRRKVSNDTDKENNSVLLKPTEIKQEHTDVNSSGSDDSKNTVSADGDSSMHSNSLGMQRTRDKFFYELPYDKQILLLKRTDNLTIADSADAQKLATELDVSFKSIHSWLKSRAIRNFRAWNRRLSREKTAVLDDEFTASPDALTEERALLLSYELDLSVCAIRRYFERKKTDVKTDDEQNCSAAAKVADHDGETESVGEATIVCKTEPITNDSTEEQIENDRNSITFENGNLLSPTVLLPQYVPSGRESSDCSDSSSGICLRPRTSLNYTKSQSSSSETQSSACNEKDALKKRRFVLTLRQKKLLMEQFQKTPFITQDDASVLATKLDLPVKAVQLWFHRKRLEKNKGVSSEMKESSIENETETQPVEEMLNI